MHVKQSFAQWKANFLTGLAIVLPVAASVAVVIWLFGTVANFTDTLLFFLPREWTHERGGEGPMRFPWSLLALLLAILLVGLVGRAARYYLGKKLIQLADLALLRVPLLNKIYGAFKQINDALTSSKTRRAREAEKTSPHAAFVAKPRRLADALAAGRPFTLQVAGERLRIPAGARFNLEHEREGKTKDLEIPLQWKRR